MNILLDQGVPRSAAMLLGAAGFDAVHTGEIGLATAPDSAVLQAARDGKRILVTLDADFHALLARSGAASPSVIRIRIERLRGEQVAAIVQTLIHRCRDDLERGAAVTVQQARVRVRRLPLPRP